MADTFSNDLRLRLQESGSNAGTWGDLLNGTITNIASGFGQGSEAIPNASTHTITLADGTADEARSLYLKLTGGGQACTVTLGPNTISKVWIIDNATSYTLTFSQGSGANVAIAAGAVKVIATDGAGSGAAVVDTLDGLEGSLSSLAVTGTATMDGLTVNTGSYGAVGAGSGRMYGSTTHGLVIQGNGTTNDFLFLGSDGSDSFKIANNRDISFYNSSGTSQSLYWDASAESLGIGTSSPSAKLQISQNSNGAYVTSSIVNTNAGGYSNLTLTAGSATSGIYYAPGIFFAVGPASGDTTTPVVFRNNNATERMRISGGNLLVGTASAPAGWGGSGPMIFLKPSTNTNGLVVLSGSSNNGLRFLHDGTTAVIDSTYGTGGSASAASITFKVAGSAKGEFASNGRLYLYAQASGAGNADLRYSTSTGLVTYDTSSRLVKAEIEDIPYGLSTVMALSPKRYQRTDSDNKLEVGFIADEVVEVVPELVGMMEKRFLTMNQEDTEMVAGSVEYNKMTAVLVKAIQEQQETITALTARIEQLENN